MHVRALLCADLTSYLPCAHAQPTRAHEAYIRKLKFFFSLRVVSLVSSSRRRVSRYQCFFVSLVDKPSCASSGPLSTLKFYLRLLPASALMRLHASLASPLMRFPGAFNSKSQDQPATAATTPPRSRLRSLIPCAPPYFLLSTPPSLPRQELIPPRFGK